MINLKSVFLFVLITTFSSQTIIGQLSLRIEIDGLKNSNGQVLLEFCNEKGKKISGFSQAIENKKCIIVIENLKTGNYTFKYFHDENKNQILDVNVIGIPKEGFGFSNNAKGTFGPPSLKKTNFAVKENVTLNCTPIYY